MIGLSRLVGSRGLLGLSALLGLLELAELFELLGLLELPDSAVEAPDLEEASRYMRGTLRHPVKSGIVLLPPRCADGRAASPCRRARACRSTVL